ncbi:triose-phosphate isomerase [candidate division WOR-3 bacterium]|nr:triose-phosphate isomerase [candidate division WOR-3 bacterium]
MKFICGNWKMNGSFESTNLWAESAVKASIEFQRVQIGISPPFVFIEKAVKITQDSKVVVGAQNCFWKKNGAFTGEISPKFLKEVGCGFVILGHSERRTIFKETSEEISEKVKASIDEKLKVILCVGETEKEREEDQTFEIVGRQLEESLASCSPESARFIDIAYEPVWAIGTGKVATGDTAQEMHLFIRRFLNNKFGENDIRILYGGSVKPSNWAELCEKQDIDGALVGGVSLIPTDFKRIIQISNKGE